MASPKDFPEVIQEGDPLLGNSYRHFYGGSYYHLLFPDWPRGYDRDTEAAVYLEDKEKREHRRVGNGTLSEAVRRDYWRKIDEANAHPMTDGPSMERFERDLREYAKKNPNPPVIPFGGLTDLATQQQNWASGMVDGSYMTPQPPKTTPVLDPWTCPKCGAAGNTGRFCPECGSPRPQKEGEWTCPKCGQAGNSGNFCAGCGARRPD